jgi:anti-anti-sigma factor
VTASREVDDPPRAAVLHLVGDLDFFTEDTFRERAEHLLAAGDVERFVVDLADVGIVDSSGLGLLIDLLRLCRELGLPMTLRAVPARVQQLLELSGLGEVLVVED